MIDDIERLMLALKFASEKHAQQRRKDSENTPYINHPIAVAELLCRIGKVREPEVIIAAILHDTIEDTDTKAEEIAQLFGDRVLRLVLECTDDKSLPKEERKRLQIVNAPHKSPEAKQIKIADKTNNVFALYTSPPSSWSWQRKSDYLDWTEKVVDGLKGVNVALDKNYFENLAAARSALQAKSD